MDGRLVWSRPFDAVETRAGWGTAASPVLHDNRVYVVNVQRGGVVPGRAEQGDRRRAVARGAGTRAPTGRRRTSGSTTRGRRSSPPAPAGCAPMTWRGHCCGRLAACLPSSRRRRSRGSGCSMSAPATSATRSRPVFAVRPGARGDLSVADDRPPQRVARLAPAAGGFVQHLPAGVRRLLLHAARPRLFHLPRRPHRREEVYGRQRIKVGAGFSASPWALRRQDLTR